MNSVQPLLVMLLGRWGMSFAGLTIASMLVWYLGPLLPWLQQPLARALVITLFVLAWMVVNSLLSWRRRRRERALTAGLMEASPEEPAAKGRQAIRAETNEESAQLRERLRQSLALLRKARGRRGYLYEQPWFLMIGPPGAGKTTALTQCGLQFPLAQPDGTGGMSSGSVAGVGGTRLCDWWFADEAVLIDTAGRYTTQDSEQSVDRAGWLAFLDLLRRTRPRQPLNGVLVVISLADVATVPAAERLSHALAIRSRIKEASDRLKVRLPVYAVFSKADRIAGFTEFFDDLDQQARQQVWGMTFPLSQGVEAFNPEFRLLIGRLDSRLFERLQAERSPERRVAIASFPLQIASLEAPLTEFMQTAFGGTKLDPAPLLRGVYFTSGTQEGTPIDRLTGMLARTFDVDQKRAPDLRPVAGRAYFIGRTLREVILGEALLVSFDPAARLRRRVWRWGGFSTVGVATLVICLLLWREQAANSAAIQRGQVAIDSYRQTLASVPLDPVADDDLSRILPVLDAAGALSHPEDAKPHGVGRLLGLGQGGKLVETNQLAYQHALEQVLLPRLIWRLEGQMRAHLDQPVFLYEATRVYLMLGNDGPLDANLVMDWMQLDWSARYPGLTMQPIRDALLRHLGALLANPLPGVPLDGALVQMARSAFSRMSPAERVYSRIRPTSSPADVPAWSPASALGSPEADQLFLRVSGRPLTDSIPGFYTAKGFRNVLLPALAPASQQASNESWVLGPQGNAPQDKADAQPANDQGVPAIEQAVIALYAKDYEDRWDAMLSDIGMAPFRDHVDAVQKLYVMASPQSPMRDLLVSIVQQLAPARAAAQAAAQGAKPDAQTNQLSAILTPPAAAPPIGHEIDDHYQPLTDFAGVTGQAGPITDVFHLLNQLQTEMARLPNAGSPAGVLQDSQDPAQLLLAEADRQPQPVARWLHQISASGTTILAGDAHQVAATAFISMDGPSRLCHQVVDGHYPFDLRARTDASLASFARLFAPGGVLDAYFKTQLKPYVNTTGPVWHAQGVGGVAAPITDAQVLPFQQATAIRELFFPTGGETLSMHFTIKPVTIDPLSKKVVLALGQADIAWQPDATPDTSITWPRDSLNTVSLTYTPPTAAPPVVATGPWALFRLFGLARLERGNSPTHYFATFRYESRQAIFAIETDSALSPLFSHALQAFRCPVVQ